MTHLVFLLAAFVGVSLCSLGSTFAHAESKDGNSLLSRCQKKSESGTAFGYCLGYIVGIVDAIDLVQGSKSTILCIPSGVKIGQAKDIVEKYLTDHPEGRLRPGAQLDVEAITKASPCR